MITTSRLEVPPGLVLLQSCLTVGSYSGRYVIFQHRQNNLLFLMFFFNKVFFTYFVAVTISLLATSRCIFYKLAIPLVTLSIPEPI